jgi:hypothetical protein
MSYALMFNVLEGGVSEPVKFEKENLIDDRSIIILDESNQVIWLWHGSKQGLVARRTALRQAESLKGHGYSVGKSILGRDIKQIYEIDQRKIGREPETDKLYSQLQNVFSKKYNELDNLIISFDIIGEVPVFPKKVVIKEEPKKEVQVSTKPVVVVPTPKPAMTQPVTKSEITQPVTKPVTTEPAPKPKPTALASEYDTTESLPSIKPAEKMEPTELVSKQKLITDAKVAFVISGVIDHFADVWISKKDDGSYAVEEMNGPICTFSIKEGGKINFTANSFSGIDPKIKTAIQKKFIELSKLL